MPLLSQQGREMVLCLMQNRRGMRSINESKIGERIKTELVDNCGVRPTKGVTFVFVDMDQ